MAYRVPDLPYAYDALEPHISEATMRAHHDRHHQAYVDKANALLGGTEWEELKPREILRRLDDLPDELRTGVRDNAGGQYNHCMFWRSMKPGGGGEPGGALGEAIAATFGSYAGFRTALTDAAITRFGSGWAWLVHDGAGLAVTSTANQDNPVIEGSTPLLGLDVWEHAYYLDYHNRRPDWVAAFFELIDWDNVAERFDGVAG